MENRIRPESVPFSDRGSRLLVYAARNALSTLFVRLTERLTTLTPGPSSYRNRPPCVHNLRLVNSEGRALPFEMITYPQAALFQPVIGEFALMFQDHRTLRFGLPARMPCGISFIDLAIRLSRGEI
jgi:putative isomerase